MIYEPSQLQKARDLASERVGAGDGGLLASLGAAGPACFKADL
jgi:hypothetical protein